PRTAFKEARRSALSSRLFTTPPPCHPTTRNTDADSCSRSRSHPRRKDSTLSFDGGSSSEGGSEMSRRPRYFVGPVFRLRELRLYRINAELRWRTTPCLELGYHRP